MMNGKRAHQADDEITRANLFRVAGSTALAIGGASVLAGCGSSVSGGNQSAAIGPGSNVSDLSQLAPFSFVGARGPKPSLPKRLSFANIETSPVFTDLADGLQAACKDRGLDFVEANADDNVATNISQIRSFLQRETGALYLLPLGNGTQGPVISQALNDGIVVYNQTASPSTSQVIIPQSKIGQAQGEAAVRWIREHLGGAATVLLFNFNALTPTLGVRYEATVKALRQLGRGLTLVEVGVDLSNFNDAGGFSLTSSALQAHPHIQVILGVDTLLTGVAKAVTEAHNTTVAYISGSNGEADVLAAIKAGGLIKQSFGAAFPLAGYAAGWFAADWLEGKSIPQGIILNPVALSSVESVTEYNRRNTNPGQYWRTSPDYMTFVGTINYQSRRQYLRNTLSR